MKSSNWIRQQGNWWGYAQTLIHSVLLAVLLLHSLPVTAAGVNKWVDAEGKIHYGERPPTAVLSSEVKTALTIVDAADAKSNSQVTLYTTSWCGYCKQARRYLASKGIAYRELDIERNPAAKRQHALAGGRGVPLIVRGERSHSGFSESSYDRFFAE